jgi:glyoxylase-like metal-dependent hydrolase (beta-lactamase superfamily II)
MSIPIDGGGIRCHVLSDGGRRVSPRFVFKDYDEAVQGPHVRGFLDAEGLLPGRLSALLVEAPSGPVLVDAGMGAFGGDLDAGHVGEELAALGVDADAIRTVVITHGHADHVGGLILGDGAPRFANARHLIHAAEAAFWTSDEASELPRNAGAPARVAITALRAVALLDEVHGDTAAAPGVQIVGATGHTPGHLAAVVGDSFLWAGDALVAGLNVAHPEWTSAADMDHAASEATRRRLLAMVADRRLRLGAVHMPVMGTVRRTDAGFAWDAQTSV